MVITKTYKMKNNRFFKTALLRSLFMIAVLIVGSSCMVNMSVAKTGTPVIELAGMKVTISDADINFMGEATEINLEEIRLSEVVKERSKNIEIRELGKKLTNQHYQSLLDLTALAARKNITIPTKLGDKENVDYEKLNHMSGVALDKEYIIMMVNEHKEAIALFEKVSKTGIDPDIKQWALATLPEMHTHLNYAVACQGIFPMCSDTGGH
jgi:putative membrane protein